MQYPISYSVYWNQIQSDSVNLYPDLTARQSDLFNVFVCILSHTHTNFEFG